MSKLKLWLIKTAFNFWPCIWGSGARVTFISPDFYKMQVKIPLNWLTRNKVGTIFGGSLYASVDPFYMIMYMRILGRDYVVWDKGAEIAFRRPGKATLYADFEIKPEHIIDLKQKLLESGELTFDIPVEIKDEQGVVHVRVKKIMYAATKEYYKQKLAQRSYQEKQ